MRLSNNLSLPTLPAFAARSTWAIVFAAVITVCNALGFDILGVFTAIGAGSTPDEVIQTGNQVVAAWQTIAPLVLGIWAWLERRAPNFRLAFWRSEDISLRMLGVLSVGLLMAGLPAATAQAATCGSIVSVMVGLAETYAETEAAKMTLGKDNVRAVLTTNPKTGTWTLMYVAGSDLCHIASGNAFSLTPRAPPGDPS